MSLCISHPLPIPRGPSCPHAHIMSLSVEVEKGAVKEQSFSARCIDLSLGTPLLHCRVQCGRGGQRRGKVLS